MESLSVIQNSMGGGQCRGHGRRGLGQARAWARATRSNDPGATGSFGILPANGTATRLPVAGTTG